jgi:TonB-dependent starch-binding outer membrane protein SusC
MRVKPTAMRLWLAACIFLLSLSASAQQKTISGKVTDANNQPVVGASVVIKGTTTGTTTDEQGGFTLTVPNDRSILTVSAVGMDPQDVSVSGLSTVTVSMTSALSTLNEVVVTGYSTQQRKNITGAVTSVKGTQLQAVPSGNIEQQFQGRASGVVVITSGQPGTASQVRIRGFSSFLDNNPLYIVDGIPVFTTEHLNANDIESTTILKDAASASIYGARAAAGVILVTTKKGRPGGKVNVSYDMSYGMTVPGDGLKLLTPQQQADLTWEALKAAGQATTHAQYGSGATPVLPDYLVVGGENGLSGLSPSDPRLDPAKYNTNFDLGSIYQVIRANKTGTDWYDELTDSRPIQNHTLGLNGGSDVAKYYTSFSYYNEQGPIINTYLKKYIFRANTEFKIKDIVRLGENFQYSYRDNPNLGAPADENDIMFALTINPLIPVYDEGGGFAGTVAKGFNNSTQPVARRILSKDNRGFSSFIFGNAFAEVDFLKNFTFRTSFGGFIGNFQNRFINYRTYWNSENVGNTTFGEGAGSFSGWTWTNNVRFDRQFGVHDIKALAGIESVADNQSRALNASGLNPFTNSFNFTTLTNTDPSGRTQNSFGEPARKLYSQYAKVDYVYNNRYLFSGTIRRDGASVFSEDNQYGIFPAFSAGWRITEERFLQDVSWINDLKIRGGWGKMGNSRPVTPINRINAISGNGTTAYDVGGSNGVTFPGISVTGIGNPFAKWEAKTTTNIGFDGTFFKNHLDVIFDWYTSTTSDLLFRQDLPATLGTATAPFVNIGSMKNDGIDVMLTYRNTTAKNFRYEADAIFTKYNNEIIKVADIVDYFDVNFTNRIGGGDIRNAVGQPVSSFYGYKVIGLFQSDADVSSSPAQDGAGPGRFKYADLDGDKVITTADRTYLGNPNPDFTYGFNARLFFKNFDFEALFYGVKGGDVLNFTRWFTDFYPSFAGIGKSERVLNAWTPQNTATDIPRFENVSNFSTNAQLNSYYVESASYLRLRSVKLGYTFPLSLINKVGFEKIRFFIQGTNLFTATNYTGTDPEVSGVDTNFGIDIGNYPANRQFLVGLNLGF